ncbi:MAG TPA: hypothetical protein VGQ86_11500, partial [Candidatus Limnocylindria bacterium]|nr:hypothetical protein [Candidatus Limnocylindria bacterium]
ASYGVRASNLAFLAGIAIVTLVGIIEALSLRRLLSIPIAVVVTSLFFFVAGYPTLSLPVCPSPPGAVACAAEGARERTLGALGGVAFGLVLTLAVGVLSRSEPSATRRR